MIQVNKKKAIEDELFLIASEAGAEDFESDEDVFMITTKPDELYKVKEEMEKRGAVTEEATLEMIPKSFVKCSKEEEEKNHKLVDWLENLDDVDSVYHNMKIGE